MKRCPPWHIAGTRPFPDSNEHHMYRDPTEWDYQREECAQAFLSLAFRARALLALVRTQELDSNDASGRLLPHPQTHESQP